MPRKCITCFLLMVWTGQAASGINDKSYTNGWYWGHKDKNEQAVQPQIIMMPELADSVMPKASEVVQAIGSQVNEAKAEMILHPTEQNVAHYITLQNKVLNMAGNVSTTWQQVLLHNAALDYSLQQPTNSMAQQIKTTQDVRHEKESVARFAQSYGLFYFYQGHNPYAKAMAGILRHFADEYGVYVVPITLDGTILPEYPNSKTDNGQAAKMGMQASPALFAVERHTHKAFPVSYGVVSETDLRQRLASLYSAEGLS